MADYLNEFVDDTAAVVMTVEQNVPLRTREGDGWTTFGVITVTALPTGVDGLVICPSMGRDNAGVLNYLSTCTLTHVATGRSLMHGESHQLRRVATELAQFDWTFTDPQYLADPANADMVKQVTQIIRAGQMADAAGSDPIRLMGDSEEMAAARGAAPAHTLLREQLDWWLEHNKRRPDPPAPAGEMDTDAARAWHDGILISVQSYGVIYLMAALHRYNPQLADVAARELYGAWDSGELGEWVYQWGQELTAGQPLTLYGIPDGAPLMAEQDGGFNTEVPGGSCSGCEPTLFPTAGMNFVDLNGKLRGVNGVTPTPNSVYDTCYRVDYIEGASEIYGVVGMTLPAGDD